MMTGSSKASPVPSSMETMKPTISSIMMVGWILNVIGPANRLGEREQVGERRLAEHDVAEHGAADEAHGGRKR